MFNSQNAANAVSAYAQTRITAYRKPQAWIAEIYYGEGSRLVCVEHATVTVNATSYREAKDKATLIMYAEHPGLFLAGAHMIFVKTYAEYERGLRSKQAA